DRPVLVDRPGVQRQLDHHVPPAHRRERRPPNGYLFAHADLHAVDDVAIVICVSGTLIARELHKAHGASAVLAGVSVTVAPGDVLGVVGPNGAGKSTLLRLLAGIDRPDRGSVRLTAGTAGYLPQEPDRAPGERLHDYLGRRTGVAAAD